jgi:HAMP domain-containing protein
MKGRILRRKYLIHPSSQLKYIAMSILPTLLVSIFGIYFLVRSGEFIFLIEKEQFSAGTSSIDLTIQQLEREAYPREAVTKIKVLKSDLLSLRSLLDTSYYDAVKKWNDTKSAMILILAAVIVFSAVLSLLYSHRIAGPIFRLRRSIDMLSQGQDIPPVHVRRYDEFKELAESVEQLRETLKKKGILGWREDSSHR